jgi:hypothetical protein
MPLYPIVAQHPEGMRAEVMEYPLAAGQTVRPGSLVTLNAAGDATVLTAVDPTAILGVSLSTNEAGTIIYEATVLVALAKGNTYFAMRGSRAPTQDDVGDVYGIIQAADGEWQVDFADTLAPRVRIMEVHVDRGLCICQILEANRQIPV